MVCIRIEPSHAFNTKAKSAFLYDAASETILLDKHSDQQIEPASMTKMMTVYLLFDQLKKGKLTLEDTFLVSKKAWRKGGSKMFVEVGKRVRIEDLIRGIIVQSGNDACIVVAEGIAGSEDRFAKLMTKKAREIGMKHTLFRNASGWPDPKHRSTARDLAILAQHLWQDFPEYYHYFAENEFTFHDIRQFNRNPLLGAVDGVDGIKTGFTESAGYGITVSAERDGRRLFLVVTGLESAQARGQEAERVLEWGFREFETYSLFKAGQQISKASVWLGSQEYVPLIIAKDVVLTLPIGEEDAFDVKIRYKGPIPAPIHKGQQVAVLKIKHPKMELIEVPLYAGKSIEDQGFFEKKISALFYYINKKLHIQ